jgi:uncharacterized membrane protein
LTAGSVILGNSGMPPIALMRWLMIALFVSVAALLIASAGVARHIWHRHKQTEPTQAPEAAEEEIPMEERQ